MGICTTLIGVLPTYAQIGILLRITGNIANYGRGWAPGGNFPRGYHAGRVCAEKESVVTFRWSAWAPPGTLSDGDPGGDALRFEREQLTSGMAYSFPASVKVVMIFAIWLRMN